MENYQLEQYQGFCSFCGIFGQHLGIFGKWTTWISQWQPFQQRIYHCRHISLCSVCLSLAIAANAKAADITYQLLAALPNLPNQTATSKHTKAELVSNTKPSCWFSCNTKESKCAQLMDPLSLLSSFSLTTHFTIVHHSQQTSNRYLIIITIYSWIIHC